MTTKETKRYLIEMERSNLLTLLYNGWRMINDQPILPSVTLELAIGDDAFVRFTKENLEDEFNKGL